MRVSQIASLLNDTIQAEGIGESQVVTEDLSNIVDIGKAVLDYTGVSGTNYDSFVKTLIDQVGKVVFVNRVYTSQAPNLLKDSWEYGSVLQKVRCELPDAEDNKTWNIGNLANGTSVDPFELSKPEVEAKFFNSKTTFEVPITLAEIQLKEAFKSAADMNRFISMIENRIQMKLTLCSDAMVMRTMNNLIGQKIGTQNNVINLLAEYKKVVTDSTLTAEQALQDRDFLKFATKHLMLYKKFLAGASVLYNNDGYITFTPEDKLKFVLLGDFAKSMEVYLLSDTFHKEFVSLPGYSEIPFWQGSGDGTTATFEERSKIDVKVDIDGTATEIAQGGLVGVMFDEEAACVCNENQRVTSIYNPKGEYWNYFYKFDCSYMNDLAENCVVFVVADADEEEDVVAGADEEE